MVVNLYKKRGETPLQALDQFRLENPHYQDVALSYAGRLDPMAEGDMLILVGDENKEREKYLGWDKEYEVDMLLGIETDSYDVLGKILTQPSPWPGEGTAGFSEKLKNFFRKSLGKFEQPYPPFSSKTVEGKQLFEYTREGILDSIEIPTKLVEIYEYEILKTSKILGKDLLEQVINDINLVKGDFRQEEIKKSWHESLKGMMDTEFPIISVRVKCSSGTYMRSLAYNLGKELGIGGLAYRIRRTCILSNTVV